MCALALAAVWLFWAHVSGQGGPFAVAPGVQSAAASLPPSGAHCIMETTGYIIVRSGILFMRAPTHTHAESEGESEAALRRCMSVLVRRVSLISGRAAERRVG